MKVVLFLHQLDIGGTSVNAIELASALRDSHGFDVVLFSTPGPMTKYAEERRLRFRAAPFAVATPSPKRISALRQVVKQEAPDLVYAWESWPCLDAFYGVHLPMRLPLLVTDMQMQLTRMLPRGIPITFGTPKLVEQSAAAGHRRVRLLLPPVDTEANSPNTVDPEMFRRKYDIQNGEILIVTVSRLDGFLKGESLNRTLEAVAALANETPVRFVLVGDGNLRRTLQIAADKINASVRKQVILLTGAILDPRAAYGAADLIVGMGSSALRGMAFAKPVIVVGENNFSLPMTADTAGELYRHGLYGLGSVCTGNSRLIDQMRWTLSSTQRMRSMGELSRKFVTQFFSLSKLAVELADCCRDAVTCTPVFHESLLDGIRTAAVYTAERRFLMRASRPDPIDRAASIEH